MSGSCAVMYFNSRSPCGERLERDNLHSPTVSISTHAPRVGSDWRACRNVGIGSNFNSRSPCGERHGETVEYYTVHKISTHAPRVGSDTWHFKVLMFRLDFNSRSPCGERPFTSLGNLFYIKFQLTLPVWGATGGEHALSADSRISTHAPRVGSDRTPH